MTKIPFLTTLLRAIQGCHNEAQAMASVGAIAESNLRQVEANASSLRQSVVDVALEIERAEQCAERLAQRSGELQEDRQQLADRQAQAQECAAKAYAAAVSAGDRAAEAEALATQADVVAMATRIEQLDRQLAALKSEADRAAETADQRRRLHAAAQKSVLACRCEEAQVLFDEAANALLLASARVFSAYEAAGLTKPEQVREIQVRYFSRARSLYLELTGHDEPAGHPPPLVNVHTVREVMRALHAREKAAAVAPASTAVAA